MKFTPRALFHLKAAFRPKPAPPTPAPGSSRRVFAEFLDEEVVEECPSPRPAAAENRIEIAVSADSTLSSHSSVFSSKRSPKSIFRRTSPNQRIVQFADDMSTTPLATNRTRRAFDSIIRLVSNKLAEAYEVIKKGNQAVKGLQKDRKALFDAIDVYALHHKDWESGQRLAKLVRREIGHDMMIYRSDLVRWKVALDSIKRLIMAMMDSPTYRDSTLKALRLLHNKLSYFVEVVGSRDPNDESLQARKNCMAVTSKLELSCQKLRELIESDGIVSDALAPGSGSND